MISFFKRQIEQIKRGGWTVCCLKIKRAWNKLRLRLFAELGIKMKMKWIEAYEFYGDKLLVKYRKAQARSIHKDKLNALEIKIEQLFNKFLEFSPDLKNYGSWKATFISFSFFQFSLGRIDRKIELIRIFDEKRKAFLKQYQLDKNELMFMPQTIAIGSIGTYENLNNYVSAKLLGWIPAREIILLLPAQLRVTNQTYLGYWSKYLTIISDPKLIRQFESLPTYLEEPMDFMISLKGKPMMSHIAIGILQEQWSKENRPPVLELLPEDRQRGWQVLEKLGIPSGAWFVCLHARDRGYYKEADKDDFRNSDINNYFPAMEFITSQGGWVIRMGDPSMTALSPLPGVIDYAHSDMKSDWMDVFLCAQCKFFIGTSSGLFLISTAFGVPSALTNFLPAYAMYCLSEKDLVIPRLCRNKITGRLINFAELLSPPVGTMTSNYAYAEHNIEVIENTKEDICDIVREMFERTTVAFRYSKEDELWQSHFRDIARKAGKSYGDERVAMNARIGRKFLYKYEQLLAVDKREVVSSLG